MDAVTHFNQLKTDLIGLRVTLHSLVSNSLLVYLDCQPGDSFGFTLWFEPTWHFCGPHGVLIGSRQAQTENPAEHSRIAAYLAPLKHRTLQSIALDERTGDLTVYFDGDYYVRTFVSDPTDDHLWHISDNAISRQLRGTPTGLYIDMKWR